MAVRYSGMVVLDITVPADPQFVAEYQYSGGLNLCNRLALQGNNIYLSNGYGDIEVVNISDPYHPSFEGLYLGNGENENIEICDGYAIMAQRTGGISAFDVSNAAAISFAGNFNTPGYASDACFGNNNSIYVADHYSLIKFNTSIVTDVKEEEGFPLPETMHLYQNYPNPFNATTSISFTLDSRQNVNLEIFNVLGQKVRTVVDDILSVGAHDYEWDGTDDGGTAVSSGVYLYRLKTASHCTSRKMMLMK